MHLSSGTPSEPAPLTLLADEELVRLARMRRTPKEREGATRAFQVLHQRYESQIFRYLVHQVQNTENAQDLTQETFLKAWNEMEKAEAHQITGIMDALQERIAQQQELEAQLQRVNERIASLQERRTALVESPSA